MKKLVVLTAGLLLLGGALVTRGADVAENWEKQCAKCHGADGKGETKMGKKAGVKNYTDAKVQAEIKDDQAFKSVKEGLKDGEKTKMKPFGETLSDAEITALVKHVRSFKK
jgi:cytochrome c6